MASFGDSLEKDARKIPLIGGLFGSPDIHPVDLDPDTKNLIHQGVQRAGDETPQDIKNQMLNGVDNANNNMFQTSDQINQAAASSGEDPHMFSAIMNKYRQLNQKDLGSFQNQADVRSRFEKGQRMQRIASAALAQQNVQTQNYAMLSQAFQQNELARAGVISSIIGAGSTAYEINQANSRNMRPRLQIDPQANLNSFASPSPGGMQNQGNNMFQPNSQMYEY